MMRCHQLVTVVACMLPRASRGVRLAGMSVTPGWSARMGGMRHLTMNEAAAEEMAVEDVPTDITAPLKSEFLQEMQWRGFIHQATNIEGLDEAALNLPLFPGIDEETGCFLFTETFDCDRLCKRLTSSGRKVGMNKHKVGAWSFRKDACEQPAAAGDGEVAARVLGHRHVNSRTMDRVYRADLRCRDLGALRS